jgi:hypothetical protein
MSTSGASSDGRSGALLERNRGLTPPAPTCSQSSVDTPRQNRDQAGQRREAAVSLELNMQSMERAVRDGQLAPVTCAACGCRLEASGTSDDAPWFHLGRMGGRDARGCRPGCVDAPHHRSGQPVLSA